MSKPHFFSRLGRDLVQQGLPRSYVRRVIGELRDHRADLARRNALTAGNAAESFDSAERELGPPLELKERIVREYRSRQFAGRHPLLTFAVAPIPLVLLIATLEIVAIGLLLRAIDLWPGKAALDPWLNAGGLTSVLFMVGFSSVLLLSPPAIATWLVCRWARTAAVPTRWLICGMALVAVTALVFQSQFAPSGTRGDGQIGWQLFAGLSFHSRSLVSVQVLQMCLPLALAALYLRMTAPRASAE